MVTQSENAFQWGFSALGQEEEGSDKKVGSIPGSKIFELHNICTKQPTFLDMLKQIMFILCKTFTAMLNPCKSILSILFLQES